MHGPYNRAIAADRGGARTPSPPASPMRSPRYRRAASIRPGRAAAPRPFLQRIAWILLSLLLRRQGIFLFAPLIYMSGMLLYMGSVKIDFDRPLIRPPPPGAVNSVYASPRLYARLREEMDADNSSDHTLAATWKHPGGGDWRPCINTSSDGNFLSGLPESNGFLYVEANGGLNQQRTSICNAVAVAGFLNATLVIPNFHFHSVWKDPSKFKDIYDEEHFMHSLKSEVRIVNKVPEYIMDRFAHNMSNVYNFKIKAYSPIQHYKDVVLPKLIEERLIRISPFANRLSMDAHPPVQRLRCLANFEALRFAEPIASLAEKLVSRMKKNSGSGKYLSVHLRFEEDMIAFSCCVYDGGEKEHREMDAARERGWKGKFTKPGRVIQPGVIRMNGKCPLTPLEVGLMLRGMGFSNKTSIYIASGKIYNAENALVPLREMFPLLQTKDTLASDDELAPFRKHSSRMAALDYTVCLYSEVFVTTQGGNFPHFLVGHRRWLYGGHSKTIKPDKRKLVQLFGNPNIGWNTLKRNLQSMRAHSDAKGIEMKRPTDNLYTYPCPDCMCRLNRLETSRVPS